MRQYSTRGRHTIRGGDACRSMPGLLAAVLAAASFAVAVQSCGDHRGPTYTGFDAGSRQLDGEIEFHLSNRAVGGGIITPDAAAAHHALLATWRPIPDGAAPPLRDLGFLEMKSQAGLLTFRKRSAIAGSAAELGCRAAPEGELVRRVCLPCGHVSVWGCIGGGCWCGCTLARLHANLSLRWRGRACPFLPPPDHSPSSSPPSTSHLRRRHPLRRPLVSQIPLRSGGL